MLWEVPEDNASFYRGKKDSSPIQNIALTIWLAWWA